MNNLFENSSLSRLATLGGILALALALSAPLWAQKNARGEEFFIISSVDQQAHQVVLMRPTQLTVIATFGPQTVYLGEKGQKLTPNDLRAGDTVWALIKPGKNGEVLAERIREGAMTETELRKLYLENSMEPSSETPIAAPPTTAPQSSAVQRPAAAPAGARPNAALRGMHRPGREHAHPHATGGPNTHQ